VFDEIRAQRGESLQRDAVGGGGGGRPNMAQAGGKDSTKLPDALAKAREVIAASYKG